MRSGLSMEMEIITVVEFVKNERSTRKTQADRFRKDWAAGSSWGGGGLIPNLNRVGVSWSGVVPWDLKVGDLDLTLGRCFLRLKRVQGKTCSGK